MGLLGLGKLMIMNIIGCFDWLIFGMYKLDGEDIFLYKDKELVVVCNWFIGFVFQ